ncbi:hypothetical protein HMPREF1990_00112 [Porphyromonas gingivalis W4087]|uniref:Uncharacterized protein n=1 Tax=Porphyromonas gingivalis F0570 TaxID=1227271 RepID=A0A0E2M6I2_PORGN|nr:hypothetical protein HMPREF1555_00767 [Porphyromonas gingivalis F0570]ERJ91308.1 hypothetical protein HMPREF1990_00112 [Porphyromonas gingivalis W4087]
MDDPAFLFRWLISHRFQTRRKSPTLYLLVWIQRKIREGLRQRN